MKIFKQITLVLFVLCLPVLLLTISISAAANCPLLYQYGFAKYDIAKVTGIDNTELNKAARGIISYWNNGDERIDITVIKNGQPFTLFNDREVGHLVDVKALFRFGYKCLLGSLVYALLFLGLSLFLWRDRKLLAKGLIWGSGLSLALMIIVGVASLINFDWLFWQFHLLSFANDLWLLDPRTDYLIMMFPQGFWFDAAIIIVAFMALLAVVLGFVGWRMSKKALPKH